MSTEKPEPAWRAELRDQLRAALAKAEGFEDLSWLEPHDYQEQTTAVLRVLEGGLKAAEERGRQQALADAAKVLRSEAEDWTGWPEKQAALKYAARLLDGTEAP